MADRLWERRTALILLLILAFVVVAISEIKGVKAENMIYIRADGSVDPSTVSIQQDGNVYMFTDNIEPKIVVERDDIVIDGANFTLQGNGGEVGIDITYKNNVTIKNVQLIGAGIQFVGANNNTIFGNLIANNHHGIGFYGDSNYNKIFGNTLMDNERGIYFSQSYNNSIYDNSFINNTRQVYDIVWRQPWYPWLLSINFWNNDTIGNYWSDYQTRYPNAVEVGSSGIGNIPYVIDENNTDHYPIINPVTISSEPPPIPDSSPIPISGSSSDLTLTIVVAVIIGVTVFVVAFIGYRLRKKDKI